MPAPSCYTGFKGVISLKKIILILALMLLIPFAVSAQEQAFDPAKDPKGFMTYLWGTPVDEVVEKEQLTLIDTKPHQNSEIKIYKQPLSEENPFQITYVFFEDKLVSGVILIAKENKPLLMNFTQSEFGPYSYESSDGIYYWEFPDTRIMGITHAETFTISFGDQKFYQSSKPL